jgi:hypothetical protein
MRYKAVFAVGFAAGYVLGARAGRQRYEQIKKMSKSFAASPAVQHTAESMQAQAAQLTAQARRMMQEKAGSMSQDLIDKVTSKLPEGVTKRFAHHTIDLDSSATYANGSS